MKSSLSLRKNISLVLATLLLCSCASVKLKTRKQIAEDEEQQEAVSQTQDEQQQEPVEPEPAPRAKLGIILGPGGIKTFAHTGVIKSLTNAKIPVSAIVGLEWGAMVAALYANSGKIHDAEWKLYKVEEEDLLDKSLFGEKYNSKTVADIRPFLKRNLSQDMQQTEIPFACPALSIWSGTLKWQETGPIYKALEKCMAYPPLFKPTGHWTAASFAIKESIEYLKKKNIDVILYIDVLGGRQVLSTKELSAQYHSAVIWSELQRHVNDFDFTGIEKVSVNTGSFKMYDFNNRNALLQAGQKAADNLLDRLVQNYNF